MQTTKYRAQILLEPEQHQALAELAQRENRSISDVVREILREWLESQEDLQRWEQRRIAVEHLTQIRERVEKEYGVYQGNLVEEVRAERDEDGDRLWRGEA